MARQAANKPCQYELDPNGDDDRWMNLHRLHIKQLSEIKPNVLFHGDSIIQLLKHHRQWNEWCVPLNAINFGIGGDQTQHVLWRLENIELQTISSLHAVVILVGTNNRGHSPNDVASGIIECVNCVRRLQPTVHVIVVPLLPRGHLPNPLRTKNAQVNSLLRQLYPDDGNDLNTMVHLIDISDSLFVEEKTGIISESIMFDYLHLTTAGYDVLCGAVMPLVRHILATKTKEPLPPTPPPPSKKHDREGSINQLSLYQYVSARTEVTVTDSELEVLRTLIPARKRVEAFNMEPLKSMLRLNSWLQHVAVKTPLVDIVPIRIGSKNLSTNSSPPNKRARTTGGQHKQWTCVLCTFNGILLSKKLTKMCSACELVLCLSPQHGNERSCFDIWHNVSVLERDYDASRSSDKRRAGHGPMVGTSSIDEDKDVDNVTSHI